MRTIKSELTRAMIPLRDELERLYERLAEARPFSSFWEKGWSPFIDVLETADTIIVKADVPGVPAADIDVSLRGEVLFMKGERRAEPRKKGTVYHRLERAKGTFERSVKLPAAVKADAVEASAKDGVLTVSLPKREEERARKVEVGGVT